MRVAPPVILNSEQKEALEQCARARSLSVRLVERARIVLLAAAGKQDKEVAAELGVTAQKAARWRKRFLVAGMVGLEKDAPRPGRTPSISAAKIKRVIHKTTQEKPAHATHWSTRTMAAAVDLSEATVRRIWHKHGLKPHLQETFKVSTDPHFAEKLETVVGL
jgi:transposase